MCLLCDVLAWLLRPGFVSAELPISSAFYTWCTSTQEEADALPCNFATCYLFQVNFWERLRMTIPYTAMEVNAQRERYRILRVNVMTVVRLYNKVRLLLLRLHA